MLHLLCFTENKKKETMYGFGKTWGWTNDYRLLFTFLGWISLLHWDFVLGFAALYLLPMHVNLHSKQQLKTHKVAQSFTVGMAFLNWRSIRCHRLLKCNFGREPLHIPITKGASSVFFSENPSISTWIAVTGPLFLFKSKQIPVSPLWLLSL